MNDQRGAWELWLDPWPDHDSPGDAATAARRPRALPTHPVPGDKGRGRRSKPLPGHPPLDDDRRRYGLAVHGEPALLEYVVDAEFREVHAAALVWLGSTPALNGRPSGGGSVESVESVEGVVDVRVSD